MVKATPHQKPVSQSKNRYRCRGKCHAYQCIQTDISWPRSEKIDPKQIKNRDIYNGYRKGYWKIHNLSDTPRQQEANGNDLLHHINEGSVLLSCNTSLTLGFIQSRPRLDYLPPRVSLITSNADHPRKMKTQVQFQKQEVIAQTSNQHQSAQITTTTVPMFVTTQGQIMHEYPDVFEGIGKFPGPPHHIHVDPGVTPKQTPCRPIPIHLKDAFQKEISKMLQAGILVSVTEVTPWINSFVLVESKDNQGQVKLRICLDPTNLNKAVTREPYHFCTLEDISHMLADACILTVCDSKKGYWHQRLDEASSYLTTFNTEIGRYRFAVMPLVSQWQEMCFNAN